MPDLIIIKTDIPSITGKNNRGEVATAGFSADSSIPYDKNVDGVDPETGLFCFRVAGFRFGVPKGILKLVDSSELP